MIVEFEFEIVYISVCLVSHLTKQLSGSLVRFEVPYNLEQILYLHPDATGIKEQTQTCSEASQEIRNYFELDWSTTT